eukprot:CAMPEP_0183708460 /NCGR_PEP_ID=MMETSP0737-20130205/4785_1 /TAXON_ID=385413 /ORGANISM="Thalassiosira miniscula, Strain CCMP1093" /LENGTH=396 /DNA_ID=CAMNT_0025936353 /DNA_START=1 /DNA_END=1191 /DNA_ORIENTATION=-
MVRPASLFFQSPLVTIVAMILLAARLRPASCFKTIPIQRGSALVTRLNGVPKLHIQDSRYVVPARTLASTRLHNTANGNYGRDELWYPPSLMDHMLYRIEKVNDVPYNIKQSLINFTINGRILGKVTPKVAEKLTSTSPFFELSTGTNQPTLTLSNGAGSTVEQRTRSVASVMETLRDSGYISGWRDELYPVAESFGSPPVFLVERAAASLLGVLEYGVHINGLVKDSENETRMWMARRSKTKSKFPGYLDHIVAGGQPAGLSLMENVVKECMEEAGIPSDVTKQGIRPAGAISYEDYCGPLKDQGEGVMSRVVLFCFDLELPTDFVPTANDGEVESFFTWGLEDIGRSMDPEYDDPIKPNCYIVIIDYLLRSGAISPDSPKYLEILRKLRSGTCS